MKTYKYWLILFTLLFIINGWVLALLWIRVHKKPVDMPMGDAKAYLIKTLQLNPGQTRQYEDMARQHFEATSKINEDSRHLHDEYFNNLSRPETSRAQIDSIAHQISADQFTVDTLTYHHFQKLRTILNDDQKKKFDEVIQNVLHMMGGHRPGRQGPPPGSHAMQPNAGQQGPPPPEGRPAKADRRSLPPCDPPPGMPPPRGRAPRPNGRPPYGPPPDGRPPYGPPDGPPGGPPPEGPPPGE